MVVLFLLNFWLKFIRKKIQPMSILCHILIFPLNVIQIMLNNIIVNRCFKKAGSVTVKILLKLGVIRTVRSDISTRQKYKKII